MSDSEDHSAGFQDKKKAKVVKKKILPKKRTRGSLDAQSVDKKSAASNSIDEDLAGIGKDLPTKRFKENESKPLDDAVQKLL